MPAMLDTIHAIGLVTCFALLGTSRIGALGLIRKMLSAVELDHQLCGMTHEVGDVVFDWYLAPEASAVQPVIAQLRPENSFSVGGFLSELARV